MVVDNMWGQLKSKLVCPECERVSIVFDPFWTLTLELPDTNVRALRVLVFPCPDPDRAAAAAAAANVDEEEGAAAAMDEGAGGGGGEERGPPPAQASVQPRLVTVHVSRRGCVWDVKNALQAACGVRRDHLYLALVEDRKIKDFLADNAPVLTLPKAVDAPVGPAANTRWRTGGHGGHGHARGLEVEGPDESVHLLAYEVPPLYPHLPEHERPEAYLVLHHRRHRPAGARGPAPGRATAEEGPGEDPRLEMLGVPTLMTFDPRWPLREFAARVWRHARAVAMLGEGEEGEAVEGELAAALRVVQTDEFASTLVSRRVPRRRGGEVEKKKKGGKEGDEEDEEEEGSDGAAPVPMDTSPSASVSSDITGSEAGEEEEEEQSSMAAVGEDAASVETEEAEVAAYLPLASAEEAAVPVGSFLHAPGREQGGAYWVAVDWEGALAGRFLGMRTPGLNEDGRLALGVAAAPEGGQEAGAGTAAAAVGGDVRHAGAGAEAVGWNPGEALTLDHCLRKYASPERLDRDNLWYCSRCKKHKQAVKTLHLWRLPRVLIVCLKRFDARDRKLDALVDFPLEGLDLSKHCHGPLAPGAPPPIYDLFAVSNHFGSRGWGHYTAYARAWDAATGAVDPQWYRYDDSACEPVSAARVKTKEVYMLFYRRREGPAAKGLTRACL